MKKVYQTNWIGGMAYETVIGNHKIIIDAGTAAGGKNKGPSPKPLMLVALTGCTGVDVAGILQKMRVQVDDIKISVEAEESHSSPVEYSSIHLVYEFWGENLPKAKIQHAVELSKEKYCGVSAMYKRMMPITYEIKYHER